MSVDPGLTGPAADAVREAVAEAVLSVPPGLREQLEHEPAAYLRLVSSSRAAAEETSRLLRESVAGARAAGHSWDTLGRLLGVSRQAAQQRFGGTGGRPTVAPGAGAAQRRVLSPLTAFDEMPVLAEAGRHGWHVVDHGTLHHVVEASDVQWEHRRVPWSPSGTQRRLQSQGWQLVRGTTFPWGYWKRPTDRPAEPET